MWTATRTAPAATLASDERVQATLETAGAPGPLAAVTRPVILFLAANPDTTNPLRLGEECAAI